MLSPVSNHRNDGYGGDLRGPGHDADGGDRRGARGVAGRAAAVRAAVLHATGCRAGSRSTTRSSWRAGCARGGDVDLIDCSSGGIDADRPHPVDPPGLSGAVRRADPGGDRACRPAAVG